MSLVHSSLRRACEWNGKRRDERKNWLHPDLPRQLWLDKIWDLLQMLRISLSSQASRVIRPCLVWGPNRGSLLRSSWGTRWKRGELCISSGRKQSVRPVPSARFDRDHREHSIHLLFFKFSRVRTFAVCDWMYQSVICLQFDSVLHRFNKTNVSVPHALNLYEHIIKLSRYVEYSWSSVESSRQPIPEPCLIDLLHCVEPLVCCSAQVA